MPSDATRNRGDQRWSQKSAPYYIPQCHLALFAARPPTFTNGDVRPRFRLSILSIRRLAAPRSCGLDAQIFVSTPRVNGEQLSSPAAWARGASPAVMRETFGPQGLRQHRAVRRPGVTGIVIDQYGARRK